MHITSLEEFTFFCGPVILAGFFSFLKKPAKWLKKNISLNNVKKLGGVALGIAGGLGSIAAGILQGKGRVEQAASDIGAAAGRGFFQENKTWILLGGGVLTLILVFTLFSRRR